MPVVAGGNVILSGFDGAVVVGLVAPFRFWIFLRIDTGGLASICEILIYSGTIVSMMWLYTPSESYLISVSNDVVRTRFR